MRKASAITLFILFLGVGSPLSGQIFLADPPQKEPGEVSFLFSLGTMIPLFLYSLNPEPGYEGVDSLNMGVGGAGALGLSFTLPLNFAIGGVLDGAFNRTVNKNYVYNVGFYLQGGYEVYLPSIRFSIPIYLNFGGNLITYRGYTNIDPFLGAGFGIYWHHFSRDRWSFGIDTLYRFVIQTGRSDSLYDYLANYMEVRIGLRYILGE